MPSGQVQRPIGFSPAEISAMINEVVVQQHAEEAAFLWTQRDRAVAAPNYRLKDLARLDERVEAHLDGLRVAGEFGWRLCEKALELGQPGEVFATGVLAFGGGDPERIKMVLKAGAADPKLQRGLISTLGWLPYMQVEGIIRDLLGSELPGVRCVGIGGVAVHRRDPGDALVRCVRDSDPRLRGRALKACGELGKTDLLRVILPAVSDADNACRFFASWSAARLGDRSSEVQRVLREIVLQESPFADRALAMALRVMELSEAKAWQRQLRNDPARLRLAAIAAGIIGDPALVEDLMKLMKMASVARQAGAAFSMITGVDLAYDDLDGDPPAGFEAAPNENPDDANVAMDLDEKLRWPGPELVAEWWKTNGDKFTQGKRYLCGRQIDEPSLQETLSKGYQPQRAAAALELALRQPTQTLFEVRAKARQQLRAMAP